MSFGGGRLHFANLAFDQRISSEDEFGNVQGGFAERFRKRAELLYLRGGEAVLAGRLAGTQAVVIRVRRDAETEAVRNDWQARDIDRGTVLAIRSVIPNENRRWLELTCEIGVAK